MGDSSDLQRLLADLERQKDAYQEAFRRVQEQLSQSAAATAGAPNSITSSPRSTSPPGTSRPRLSTFQPLETIPQEDGTKLRQISTGVHTLESSAASHLTGEESDDEEDQSLYAQGVLTPEEYDDEQLREHLMNYEWDDYGKKILEPIFADKFRLRQRPIIPHEDGPLEDRSQYTDYQIFDVGSDGAPLSVDTAGSPGVTNKPTALWHTIREVNPDSRSRKAVGRITIVREPSPILFAALHLCMSKNFDVDEVFKHLVESEASSAQLHRAFDVDPRRQSSFMFSFEYFTIVGEDCKPMKWQLAGDHRGRREPTRRANRIPITRCSSVVALSLGGKPIRKLRNPLRRARTAHGYAYDPWAPWQVLELQCYPDWNSTVDVHDSTQHYVNGVEAFMVTLLSEFQDAERRFEEIYKRITRLITPPLEFMFDSALRDKLLFEDGSYTYSRRYFWAYQTLGIMNDSMKSMINAYEDVFTDEVWEGRHRTLWPLLEPDSPRNQYYKKKMAAVRAKFDKQIQSISKLVREHDVRREEIRGLRDQLFSGTSVMESRKSVEQAEITVQQGHNIKLLTMVSIFFLPLTYVTSVFGMTNMPTSQHYWAFAVVTVTICLPFFVLVGSLNSDRGMRFWKAKLHAAFKRLHRFWARKKQEDEEQSEPSELEAELPEMIEPQQNPGLNERMAMRLRKFSMARMKSHEEKTAQSSVARKDFANVQVNMNGGNDFQLYSMRRPSAAPQAIGGNDLQSYSMRRPSAAFQATEPLRLAAMLKEPEPDPKT